MSNRTLKFYGKGYGSTPASVIVELNGILVYSGTVPTVNQANIDWLPEEQEVLFSIDVPIDLAGPVPMSCQTNTSSVVWASILGNYTAIPNPVFSQAEFSILTDPNSTQAEKIAVQEANAVPPLNSAEIALLNSTDPIDNPAKFDILKAHNITNYASSGPDGYYPLCSGDERSNVYIDGVEQFTPDPRPPEALATWYWLVEPGQTLTYDFDITPGSQ